MKGYIRFVNADTNISDKVVIRGYENEESADTQYTEYVFDKITSKLIFRHTSKSAYLPYTTALDILDRAFEIDKKQKHYTDMSFIFESHTKLNVMTERIVKEVFPLPHKSMTYQPKVIFANVTDILTGRNLLTNLEASLYAYNYNNILVRNGFRGDRVFHSSCGRLLMQTDWLMQSVKGRRQLKLFSPECYEAVRSVSSPFFKSYNIKFEPDISQSSSNEIYSNNFQKAHSYVSNRLAAVDIEYAVKHPQVVSELIEKQLEIYKYEFERDYYKNLVTSVSSYAYLDIKDILRLHIDADFRVHLDKYIADIRKIYNANKNRREFRCICSDGRLVY